MAVEREYVCKYCHKSFVREKNYLEHKCVQMKHHEEFQSPLGQAAWILYQTWFRQMRKMPPRAEAFPSSRYFRTFMNIAAFIQRVSMPKPEKFIRLMVSKDYPPTMWMLDEVYALYMDYLEYNTAPMEQVQLTIETLFNAAEKADVDVSEVFTVIHPNDLIQMIRSRRVSPWLLLMSKKFKAYFVNTVTPEQRIIMEALIRPEIWADRFAKHKETVVNIKQCIQELNL